MAIKIAAAASLINGLPEVITQFHTVAEYEDIEVTVPWYGSSGAIARQIVAGTIDPDIFIAASEEAMDVAENGSMVVSSTRFDFVANSLELIEKTTASGSLVGIITSFADVNASQVPAGTKLWLANPYEPDFVPAGIYAEAAFKEVSHWGYAYGKAWDENTLKEDVQETLSGIITGPSPSMGVVYHSDAQGAGTDVTHLAYASVTVSNSIIYPAAELTNALSHGVTDEVAAFLPFLQSNPDIFYNNGFREIGSAPPTDPVNG
jgi:molybdenum ABC transporter molybdate-binding protein